MKNEATCKVCGRGLKFPVELDMGLCSSCAQDWKVGEDPEREAAQRDAQRMADNDFYYGGRR